MCYGHGFGSLPNSLGLLISSLQKGDEIIITNLDSEDHGLPEIDVILEVDGFSALTAKGSILTCHSNIQIETTGKQLADGEYEITEKAQEIQADIARRRAEYELDLGDDPLELL